MSDKHRSLSRRRVLQYGGVGTAIAVAGCSGSDDEAEDEEGTDGEDQNGGLPDDPEGSFELAGNGADSFRDWIVPAYPIEPQRDGEQQQLYQFIDYDRAADAGMTELLDQRETFAEQIHIEPDSIEGELNLGPLTDNLPYRILFGSFDTGEIEERFRQGGNEVTAELDGYVVFENLFAIGDEAIIEHSESPEVIESVQGGRKEFEDIEAEMTTVLDLLPAAPQTTINRRDDHDDIVLETMAILDVDGPIATHSIRTLVFESVEAATSERVREIDIEGSERDEVLAEEIHGRIAMIESRFTGE